jgi:crotonobetainyl-CoA:carnitine CoA-transferase CaiB-like acyl-CoA transferase
MARPPLAHLRTVDLTDLRGALASRMLADLGADVVRIEPGRAWRVYEILGHA